MNAITIGGGGLAGLALGAALARRGIPVAVHEAGTYPRHRVCGEFLCGLDPAAATALDVTPLVADAVRLRTGAWFGGGRSLWHRDLPAAALGISRHRLDARLAAALTAAGGVLHTRSRLAVAPRPGLVWAAGKSARAGGRWLGLKCHVLGFDLAADLEMHVGRGGYVGLSRIEDGRVNVCALLARRGGRGPDGRGLAAIRDWSVAAGLESLAARLAAAREIADSHAATAGFRFGRIRANDGMVRVGDAYALIPPFTGNGMSMALEAAAAAAGPVAAYAEGEISWAAARGRLERALRCRFRRRLAWARALHPVLLAPAAVRLLAARPGLLPYRWLFRRLRTP